MATRASADDAAMAHRPRNKAGLLMAGRARLRRGQVIRWHASGCKLLPVYGLVTGITRISRGNVPARFTGCRCSIVAILAGPIGQSDVPEGGWDPSGVLVAAVTLSNSCDVFGGFCLCSHMIASNVAAGAIAWCPLENPADVTGRTTCLDMRTAQNKAGFTMIKFKVAGI